MQRCLGCMREYEDTRTVCPYCGYARDTAAAQTNYLAPGTVLQNRYLLGKALGQGGFGVTYIAWDTRMERALAIKEYMPGMFASRTQDRKTVTCFNDSAQQQFKAGLQRVLKESRTLAQFSETDGVVKVLDCFAENGTAYIVMELLRGETVRDVLKREQRLPYTRVKSVIVPVLHALREIHSTGMVHRDIAPDNIFLCGNGKVKLLDFGAARVTAGADDKTLSVMLKQGYAPIEQYSSHTRQGPYTDIYAVAATMYKMLTGVTPPPSLDRMNGAALEPIGEYALIPAAAQAVIERGLSLQANERPQSAAEFLAALEDADDAEQTVWTPMPIAPPRTQPDIPPTVRMERPVAPQADAPRKKKPPKKSIALWFVLAVLVIILAVVLVLLFRDDGSSSETTTAETVASTAAQTAVPTAPTTVSTTAREADPNDRIPIASAVCSTDQGAGRYGRNYHADNVIDGDYNTCWMAAGENAGSGAWIEIRFYGTQTVSGIELLNGNGWDGYYNGEKVESGLYDLNGRIRDFTLRFSDGSTKRFTAADVREEWYDENIFYFDRPIETDSIRLYVDSGYPGSKWTTVVCLSELAAF